MADDSTPTPEPVDTNKIIEDVTSKVSQGYEEKLKEIEEGVSEKATSLAEEKVSKLKEELINNLAGQKEPKYAWEKEGRKDPKNWDQLMSEADRIAEEKFNKKMKDWQKAQEERSKKTESQQAQEANARRIKFSREWFDLVQSGKMPEPAPELMEKLKKGETVTDQEAARDRGLMEYRKLVKTALENNDDNLKVSYYERYSQQPSGMDAPVFGSDNTNSSMSDNEEYSYEDIHK